MPTDLIIQDTKYLNQYKNGASWGISTTDYTINMAGLVMEKLQFTTTIDVSWTHESTVYNPTIFENLGSDLFRYKKSAGSFLDDDFSIGDDVDVVSGATTNSGTITIIMTDWMYIQFSSTVTTASGTSDIVSFHGTSDLTAFIYSFGLIDNNEVFNTTSKLSGNNQSYYVSSLAVGVPQTMTKQGIYEDWVTGSIRVEKQVNPSTYVQRYQLFHDFIINPYYLEGQLSNLQNVISPSLFAGGNSLKHVIGVDFRTGLSNPNSSKTGQLENILGSTGYFNENMNGFNNSYSISSISYEDSSANSADGILTSEETTIRITIEKTGGSFVSTDKVGVYHSYLPMSIDYTDKTTDFETNFIYDNIFCLADSVVVNGSNVIDEVEASVSSGDIEIIIKTTLSTSQQAYLASDPSPKFLLAIQVGDITLSNADSDRVMLIADALPYDTNSDISGLFTLNDFRFFGHNMDITTDAGYTSYKGWNEDGFACKFDFDLDTNKAALLNSLSINLEAVNTVTDESFLLDSYAVPLNSVISSGIQQINVSADRGYILQSGSQFNDVTLTTGANVGGVQNYECTFSQKISWQEWIQNLEVDTVFYDNTKTNDNFNFKASNYSELNNYRIRIVIKANVYGENSTLGTSGNTDYITNSGIITTYDYDLDNNISPRFTSTIETFTEDGATNLGGAILTNGDNTLVKTTTVDNLYSFVSGWNYWAIHRIEPVNSLNYAIEELSSLNTPPSNQLPIPISGSTLLDMQVVSGDLVTQSLVDGSLLDPNINYKLSSRVQSPNPVASAGVFWFQHRNDIDIAMAILVTKTGSTCVWDYNDGTALDTTNVTNHLFPAPDTIWDITVDTGNFSDITRWRSSNDQIYGNFNCSVLTSLTHITVSYSPELTSLTLPNATAVEEVNFGNNDLSTLDLTPFENLSGSVTVRYNSSLTTITMPSSSENFSILDIRGNDLDYTDLTSLTNLTESDFFILRIEDNSFSTEEVNHILVNLDDMSTNGFSSREIHIDGTNSAPDGSSGGYDGTTAKANLITKGFSVTTT